jgi:hypothetical protein
LEKNKKKYCLYFHLRGDNNEVFYVGIGSEKRPFEKKSRSDFWIKVVEKYGYKIDIIERNLSWSEACEKEKIFIKKFGRQDLNEGCLVNLTDGGDGNNNFSELVRKKISKSKKGKLLDSKVVDLTKKKFGTLTVIKRTLNIGKKTTWLCKCDCGKEKNVKGEYLKEGRVKSCGYKCVNRKNIEGKFIAQYDKKTNKIINVYISISEASRLSNISKPIIHHFIRGNSKSGGGYNWKLINKKEYQDFKKNVQI